MTTTTDPTLAQLLAAVVANPDEDTPRLECADRLQELGHDDRAELIRVQCELGVWSGQGHPRERELLAAHPEWLRCECPECDGTQVVGDGGPRGDTPCFACGGSGDLFVTPPPPALAPAFARELTWDRGFIDGIKLRSNEAWREVRSGYDVRTSVPTGHKPTPLLVALLRQVPTLRRVAVTDAELLEDEGCFWWSNQVPEAIRRWLDHSYGTRQDATDALAIAVVRWANKYRNPASALLKWMRPAHPLGDG